MLVAYIFPNDEREMDRLDMQHHLCKMLTGERLFFAPIINPRTIVDIGTGSGIWPIELGKFYFMFPGPDHDIAFS
jgi:methylase of polypeptide subunit release factors